MYYITTVWIYLSTFGVSLLDNHDNFEGDEEIINQIKKGNCDYFEIIVNKYSQKMFRYLYYYFNFSKITAEEVVQEVFMQLRKKLDKFDCNKKFEPRLYRLAHNHCIDRIRKNNRENSISYLGLKNKNGGNIEYENIVEYNDTSNKELNQAYKDKLILQILEKLDDKYKQIIILYYFEAKSYEEISEILKSNRNSVGTLLLRGKKKLKEIVDQDQLLKDALEFDL